MSAAAAARDVPPPADTRFLLTGTCGWTDETLARCGRFYPSSAKSAVDRLRVYSRRCPCVEIDTSTYAIPRPGQIKEWLSVVPKGFIFHMKVFGLFPSRSVATGALPRDIRAQFLAGSPDTAAGGDQREGVASSGGSSGGSTVKLSDLSPECVDALWTRMNDAIAVLADAHALGVVVWQFHTNFAPSVDNMRYMLQCRQRLRANFPMAVELRNRDWYAVTPTVALLPDAEVDAAAPAHLRSDVVPPLPPPPATQSEATYAFMRRLGIINIASDDLAAEMPRYDSPLPTYRDGRALIADQVTSPLAAVIRLHRRVGTDRLLNRHEIDDWVRRMRQMSATGGSATPFHWSDPCVTPSAQSTSTSTLPAPEDHPWTWTRLTGPLYFLIGTGATLRTRAAAVQVSPPAPARVQTTRINPLST